MNDTSEFDKDYGWSRLEGWLEMGSITEEAGYTKLLFYIKF